MGDNHSWWFCFDGYKNLLKSILSIFSYYLKLILFDILEYFHIVLTYFATLQDFYIIYLNIELRKLLDEFDQDSLHNFRHYSQALYYDRFFFSWYNVHLTFHINVILKESLCFLIAD